MATATSPTLYEKIARKNTVGRALHITIFFLLLSLLAYRLFSLHNHGFAWLVALLCESWFTFIWILNINCKWNPMDYKTYPEHLSQRVQELPPVDMFVTTADPMAEPPIITINTVLSLLAVDYPAHKLACYVSDDGCSALTFYSLVEASKFAKLWIPFCKKYNVQVRAPFRYFSTDYSTSGSKSTEFEQECKRMKDEYDRLSQKIEDAVKRSIQCDLSSDFAAFSNIERGNHPSIIKVVWENKACIPDGLPHLVYISREKRPKHPHRFKAGSMNVLTRVSGVMTNAPFMLNVDCDMYVNNPQIVRQAMCLLLGSKTERESAFVQSPQLFYDGLKDDPFGNQFVVVHEYIGRGILGIQGPFYQGTGCFHRRKVIYGLLPEEVEDRGRNLTPVNDQLSEKELLRIFGNSNEFIKSAAHALKGKMDTTGNVLNSVEAAHRIAGCGYEYGTDWGKKVGWMYGSTAEDALTGLRIHSRGWKSTYCSPKPPAFLGCSAQGGPALMTQQKRWATGLLEILLSIDSPIFFTLNAELQFRQCLAYMWILLWNLRSIPELCYATLPAYCIITNSSFLPKEPAIYIPVALYVIYNLCTLLEYLQIGLSIRAWWNNQRMTRIYCTNAWLFGVLNILLKILGISETVFEVTQKEQQNDASEASASRFTFDNSPIFMPATTLVLVQFAALLMGLMGLQSSAATKEGPGRWEFMCSVLVLLYFWPFVRGLFAKGKYGIPLSTICKSFALALLFVQLCKVPSMG